MSHAARVRSIAVGSVVAAVVATCVPMTALAMGRQLGLLARARAGSLEPLVPMPARAILRTPAIPLAGQTTPTRAPASPTNSGRPGLPEPVAPPGTENVEADVAGNDQDQDARPTAAQQPTREVLLSMIWPEDLPRRVAGQVPSTIEATTLRVLDRGTHIIAVSAAPRTYAELGIRPTVVDEARGLVEVEILTPHPGQGPAPYFTVDESIDLVVGGEGVVSSRTGFTIAATGIRQVSSAREREYPPITPTNRPPGDAVRAPVPGSPSLATRPGPPDPGVARAAVSQPQPAGRPVPIVLRIERPDLRVELSLTSGTTGTLRLPDESAFGIRPTRFYSARARFGFGPVIREVVRVEILDLAVSPWKSLGVVDVPAGESVQSATSPAFTITLVDRLAWNRR